MFTQTGPLAVTQTGPETLVNFHHSWHTFLPSENQKEEKMPGQRKETMDIRELLRYIQHGESDRAVEKATGVNRKTVARYREWATEQGLLEEALPPLGELHRLLKETMNTTPPPQNTSSVEPYRALVTALRERGVEMAAIHQRLIEQGYTGSYSSVRRFVRKLEPVTPEAMVRVETLPGEEGQVDFGFAGELVDPETGELRRAWAFVMALSWSRHQYVEFVFDQKLETWLRLHRNAFSFFGGVPERVVVDNLKAAIIKACFHEPQAQHSYRECAEHYGFLIAACRPYTPRHKGKVEKGGVHYVKRNFLAGRDTMSITEANQKVLRWVNDVAGQRRHGTTKEAPLARFEVERPQLQPLPDTPYDLAIWKHIKKLHADCYVVFEDAYYSVPWRLIEQPLWVCGGTAQVRVYDKDYQLVATHERASKPGQRQTHLDHLPAEKVPGLTLTREICRKQAAEIGPATEEVVNRLLDHRPEDRLRTAGRLLKLADRFGTERLEASCTRALLFDDAGYVTIKRILEQELDVEAPIVPEDAPPAQLFVRKAAELVEHLFGGTSWN
jgi:transposase